MAQAHQTSSTFTIFVELFLGLITAKALDAGLASDDAKSLGLTNFIFLASFVVIIVHSFSYFLKVSSQPSYSEVLDQQGPRGHIRVLFVAMIFTFVILYLMAYWFSRPGSKFLFASLLLAISWAAIDYFSSYVIKAYYRDKQKSEEAKDDPLFAATADWVMLDLILSLYLGYMSWSVWKATMKIEEAALGMLALFIYTALRVEQKLPSQKTEGNHRVEVLEQEQDNVQTNHGNGVT
jgi:uncharacterized membrane protein YbjE (DUF340 family)